MKSVLAYFLLLSICLGQTITLPKEVTGELGGWVKIPADTDGEIVKWMTLDARLNLFPPELLNTTKIAVVTTIHAGRYDVIAWTAKDNIPSDAARTTVIIGNAPGPNPPPPDTLSDFSKTLRDGAIKVGTKEEARKLAEDYSRIITRINAGEYNSLAFLEARTKIVSDVFTTNQATVAGNPKWLGWFENLASALTALELQGKLDSVTKINATFVEVQAGLNAAAKDTSPDPAPTPDPVHPPPIPDPGFRVMILYEKDDILHPFQLAIIAGEEVANYLDKTCIEEPDGTSGYRIYDDDADLSDELPVWKTAFQRRPLSVPWVIISNGKTGYEGPLPATPSAFIELCKKYEPKSADARIDDIQRRIKIAIAAKDLKSLERLESELLDVMQEILNHAEVELHKAVK